MTHRMITINDFLTFEEIDQAKKLYAVCEPGHFAKRCAALIIQPNMARINKQLGKENDAMYLAYAIEYTLMQDRDIEGRLFDEEL